MTDAPLYTTETYQPAPKSQDDDCYEARPPAFSDESIALEFAANHADELRYVARWGHWLSWTGTHWRFDETLAAFDKVRATCRRIASACNDGRIAAAIASAKTVAAVERLSKSDRRLAGTIDQWDEEPMGFEHSGRCRRS